MVFGESTTPLKGLLVSSEVVEQVLQNKLTTTLAVLTGERQRVSTKEVKRDPHRDKEQRERLREITTLQIVLTVLRRSPVKYSKGHGEQPQAGTEQGGRHSHGL